MPGGIGVRVWDVDYDWISSRFASKALMEGRDSQHALVRRHVAAEAADQPSPIR